MSKTIFSLAVGGLLLALGFPTEAQQAKKVSYPAKDLRPPRRGSGYSVVLPALTEPSFISWACAVDLSNRD
jgi:hypothetical protein